MNWSDCIPEWQYAIPILNNQAEIKITNVPLLFHSLSKQTTYRAQNIWNIIIEAEALAKVISNPSSGVYRFQRR
jgi:hypothetical protein